MIDELTQRLLAPSLAVQPLGRHVMKGIAQPVAAFAVSAERAADSSFDARKGPDLAPMVGRDQELALLLAGAVVRSVGADLPAKRASSDGC